MHEIAMMDVTKAQDKLYKSTEEKAIFIMKYCQGRKFDLSKAKNLPENYNELLLDISINLPLISMINLDQITSFTNFLEHDFSVYDKDLVSIAVNSYDELGNTPLCIAADYSKELGYKVMEKLISLGADVNLTDKRRHFGTKTPIYWACAATYTILDSKDKNYASNLLYFSKNIEFLISKGADITTKFYDKQSVLDYCIKRNYMTSVTILKRHLEKAICNKDGETLSSLNI